MTEKKFFGIMGNASNFLKKLTLVNSSNYGWTECYLDTATGHYWQKYMVDRDTGRYYNLMLLTPRPLTKEIIDIAFSSTDFDEVEGATHRLFIDEEDEKADFRPIVYERLKSIDLSRLTQDDSKRIKTIILNGHLTDRTNRREVIGKHYSEIQKDADLFKEIAEYSEMLLKQL
jgi:hypothetical protein